MFDAPVSRFVVLERVVIDGTCGPKCAVFYLFCSKMGPDFESEYKIRHVSPFRLHITKTKPKDIYFPIKDLKDRDLRLSVNRMAINQSDPRICNTPRWQEPTMVVHS